MKHAPVAAPLPPRPPHRFGMSGSIGCASIDAARNATTISLSVSTAADWSAGSGKLAEQSITPASTRPGTTAAAAVSYTHLDVYKRQILDGAGVPVEVIDEDFCRTIFDDPVARDEQLSLIHI